MNWILLKMNWVLLKMNWVLLKMNWILLKMNWILLKNELNHIKMNWIILKMNWILINMNWIILKMNCIGWRTRVARWFTSIGVLISSRSAIGQTHFVSDLLSRALAGYIGHLLEWVARRPARTLLRKSGCFFKSTWSTDPWHKSGRSLGPLPPGEGCPSGLLPLC